MSPISRFPFPSIHHVLDAEPHEHILPRVPSVITVVDQAQAGFKSTSTSTTVPTSDPSNHHDLMKTIDLRDAEPMARGDEEQFSFIVQFPDEDPDNEDARTVFEEKRPTTSRGSPRWKGSNDKQHNFSILAVTAVRKLLPVRIIRGFLRHKMVQH